MTSTQSRRYVRFSATWRAWSGARERVICTLAWSNRIPVNGIRNGVWLVWFSRATFGVEDAEYLVAEPSVPYPCAAALLAEDAVSCQAPEEVGGTGLADSELLLDVAHGEDGTGEQQVDDFRCPATGSAQMCPVLFAQI